MSEHQYVAFRAIDRPVDKKNLAYMRDQSSRAEITPWSFDNEYEYGDFHGNAPEMLRRGYDIHLHYADFGIRTLLIRLPHGLPNAAAAKPYFGKDSPRILKDKQRDGVILHVEACYEPGDLEDLWEFDDLLDRLKPLRNEILDGDLRPLYLMHLAMAVDGNHDPAETKESPVPAGLAALSDAQRALAEFYGLSESLISAAARNSPPLPSRDDPSDERAAWLRGIAQSKKDAWLIQLLSDAEAAVRAEILAEFQKSRPAPAWPTVAGNRTIAELESAAVEVEEETTRKAAEKAARQRAKRLVEMAADPKATLRETESLVKERSRDAYDRIAQLLAELRQALAGSRQSGLADQQALKLNRDNPTLKSLVGALRREGFLPK